MPVAPTIFDDQEYEVVRWVNETGTSLQADVARFSDITVQAVGTGTVTIEGSNDGTNFVALNVPAGTPISLDATANEMSVLLEHPSHIRAVVAGGTATVTALASGNR